MDFLQRNWNLILWNVAAVLVVIFILQRFNILDVAKLGKTKTKKAKKDEEFVRDEDDEEYDSEGYRLDYDKAVESKAMELLSEAVSA